MALAKPLQSSIVIPLLRVATGDPTYMDDVSDAPGLALAFDRAFL